MRQRGCGAEQTRRPQAAFEIEILAGWSPTLQLLFWQHSSQMLLN
jgi:hypothetical protein